MTEQSYKECLFVLKPCLRTQCFKGLFRSMQNRETKWKIKMLKWENDNDCETVTTYEWWGPSELAPLAFAKEPNYFSSSYYWSLADGMRIYLCNCHLLRDLDYAVCNHGILALKKCPSRKANKATFTSSFGRI